MKTSTRIYSDVWKMMILHYAVCKWRRGAAVAITNLKCCSVNRVVTSIHYYRSLYVNSSYNTLIRIPITHYVLGEAFCPSENNLCLPIIFIQNIVNYCKSKRQTFLLQRL